MPKIHDDEAKAAALDKTGESAAGGQRDQASQSRGGLQGLGYEEASEALRPEAWTAPAAAELVTFGPAMEAITQSRQVADAISQVGAQGASGLESRFANLLGTAAAKAKASVEEAEYTARAGLYERRQMSAAEKWELAIKAERDLAELESLIAAARSLAPLVDGTTAAATALERAIGALAGVRQDLAWMARTFHSEGFHLGDGEPDTAAAAEQEAPVER